MASRIKLKSSTTPNSVPQISDLSNREVALNINDRTLFVNDNGTIREVLNADPNDETIVAAMFSSTITDGVGNTWYVSKNGTDKATIGSVNPRLGSTTGANAWGKTEMTAFASLKYCLDNYAQDGDIVLVSSGVFQETFPLSIPPGVTVRGAGIKATHIEPTVATNNKDAFLLEGEANIEDLTVKNFYYDSVNDTGYGFRLASNFTITDRRAYVQNVTVITKGSVTSPSDPRGYNQADAGRGALVDGSVVNSNSVEASILFNECTFIVPNSIGLYLKNGARCEWLNSFTYFAADGILGESPASGTGFAGSARTRLNLQGETGNFNAGSGNQIGLIRDGSTSLNATYTTSGPDDNLTLTVVYTNHGLSQGDLVLITTTSGAQSGITQFHKIVSVQTNSFVIDGIFAGTSSAGNLTFIRVSGYGTIDENDGTYVYLDGKGEGRFIATDETVGKTVTANGNVVTSTTQAKFGLTSAKFDGTGDWLQVPTDSDFNFSTGDFTLEAFVYLSNTSGSKVIFDFRSSSLTEISPVLFANGTALDYYVNGSSVISGGALSPNTWYHVALSRSSAQTKLFLNGAQVGVTYTDQNDFPTRGLRIGANVQGSSGFNGYIDEVRISKGISRYGSGFTPTTVQFVADEYTSLLLHMEGANNDAIFIDNSIVAQDIRTSAGGTATFVTLADYTKFGAELRSISSANVYGQRGVTANGQGVSLRLISHNFGYIGLGGSDNNDVSLVVQSNEVIEQNNGRVFFTSTDQSGDFRVGDLFLVDQEKGTLSFAGQGGAGGGAGTSFDQLLVSDGNATTTILPTSIEVGAFTFFGNTISTTSGGINLTPFTGNSINTNARVNLNVFNAPSTELSLAFDADFDTGIRKPITLGNGYFDLVSNNSTVVRVAPGEFRSLSDINIASSIPDSIAVATPGYGYRVGTYTNIPVIGGSGSGLRADVVVTAFSGQVTNGGSGYISGTYPNLAFTNVQGSNNQTGSGTGGTGTVVVKGIEGGAIVGGSGYTDNTYSGVPLNGGSGTGAVASITVSGGSVTDVTIENQGNNGYTAGNTLTINNANLTYVDGNGQTQVSGGSGFSYTVPADSYTVTQVNPPGTWAGNNYQIGDAISATVPGGGSGFVFEFSQVQFLSSANIVNQGDPDTAVAGEGYAEGDEIRPYYELRANDSLAGIGATVTYNVQIRTGSGGGNRYFIDLGSGYVETPDLVLEKNTLYKFVFSPTGLYPGTFATYGFAFSTTADGSNTAGGVQYTELSGSLNANNGGYIIVTEDTPSILYYYSPNFPDIGGSNGNEATVDTTQDLYYGSGGTLGVTQVTLTNYISLTKTGNIGAESIVLENNAVVNNNLTVLGNTNLATTTIQNLVVSGVLTSSGGINSSGDLTVLGNLGTNGYLNVNGGTQPSSIDGNVEFDTNLLQIDAANNRVSILGPTDPQVIEDYTFEVNGSSKFYSNTFLATDSTAKVSIGFDPGPTNLNQLDEKLNVEGNVKVTGNVYIGDGTEVLPSITFISDDKLGFYKSDQNEVGLTAYNGPILKASSQDINFFKPVSLINKSISEYTVTPGRGYVYGVYQDVQFTGGTGADFVADVTVGFVGNISSAGSGYTSEVYNNIPVVYTTLATGAITLLGTVTPGTNYVDGTYSDVPLTSGSGTGATADITISSGGVTSVTLKSRGQNYQTSNNLSAATANIGGSKLSGSLLVSNGGSGYTNGTYTSVPLQTVTGSGTGALATVVVSAGSVTSATVTSGGGGYTNTDTFTVDAAELLQGLTYTLSVTDDGSNTNYVFSGTDEVTTHSSAQDPTITASQGDVLVFNVNATGHPFRIVTNLTGGTYDAIYNVGTVVNNGATSGTVTFDTSLVSPGTYYYVCENHGANMQGIITINASTLGSGVSLTAQTVTTGSGFNVVVSQIGATGTGSGAQAKVTIEGGSVTKFEITNPGSGYKIGEVVTVNYTDLQYNDPVTGQLTTSDSPSIVFDYTITTLNAISYLNIKDFGSGYSIGDVLDLDYATFYDPSVLGYTLFILNSTVGVGQRFFAGPFTYEVTAAGTVGSVLPSFGRNGVSTFSTISNGSGYPKSATLTRIAGQAVTGSGTNLLLDVTTNSSGAVTSISPSGGLSGDGFSVGDRFSLDDDSINTGILTLSIVSGGDNGGYGSSATYDLPQNETSGSGGNAIIRLQTSGTGNITSVTLLQNGIGYAVGDTLTILADSFGITPNPDDPTAPVPTDLILVVDALTTGSGALYQVSAVASSVVSGDATIAHYGYYPFGFSFTVDQLQEFNNITFDAVDGIVYTKKVIADPNGIDIGTTLSINNNTISTSSGNLVLSAESNSQVLISGSGALGLPVGGDNNRPGGPATGSVRYNTDRNQFEGYNGSYFVSLGGVRDVDGNTYITAEKNPGDNDNNLWFYNDGSQTLRISQTDLNLDTVDTINSNTYGTAAEWSSESVVTQYDIETNLIQQYVYHGDNVYSIDNDGTYSTVAPTHTTGTVVNGDVNLTWVSYRYDSLDINVSDININLNGKFTLNTNALEITSNATDEIIKTDRDAITFGFEPASSDKYQLLKLSNNGQLQINRGFSSTEDNYLTILDANLQKFELTNTKLSTFTSNLNAKTGSIVDITMYPWAEAWSGKFMVEIEEQFPIQEQYPRKQYSEISYLIKGNGEDIIYTENSKLYTDVPLADVEAQLTGSNVQVRINELGNSTNTFIPVGSSRTSNYIASASFAQTIDSAFDTSNDRYVTCFNTSSTNIAVKCATVTHNNIVYGSPFNITVSGDANAKLVYAPNASRVIILDNDGDSRVLTVDSAGNTISSGLPTSFTTQVNAYDPTTTRNNNIFAYYQDGYVIVVYGKGSSIYINYGLIAGGATNSITWATEQVLNNSTSVFKGATQIGNGFYIIIGNNLYRYAADPVSEIVSQVYSSDIPNTNNNRMAAKPSGQLMVMGYDSNTSSIVVSEYNATNGSLIGSINIGTFDSNIFDIEYNSSLDKFLIHFSINGSSNPEQSNYYGVVTSGPNFNQNSLNYFAPTTPINDDGTLANAGDISVKYIGTVLNDSGTPVPVFLSTGSTTNKTLDNSNEVFSVVTSIANETTYNIKVVCHTVKR